MSRGTHEFSHEFYWNMKRILTVFVSPWRSLFVDGARWDHEYGNLADSNPMELSCSMPIIHFKPVEAKRRSQKGIYQVRCTS